MKLKRVPKNKEIEKLLTNAVATIISSEFAVSAMRFAQQELNKVIDKQIKRITKKTKR